MLKHQKQKIALLAFIILSLVPHQSTASNVAPDQKQQTQEKKKEKPSLVKRYWKETLVLASAIALTFGYKQFYSDNKFPRPNIGDGKVPKKSQRGQQKGEGLSDDDSENESETSPLLSQDLLSNPLLPSPGRGNGIDSIGRFPKRMSQQSGTQGGMNFGDRMVPATEDGGLGRGASSRESKTESKVELMASRRPTFPSAVSGIASSNVTACNFLPVIKCGDDTFVKLSSNYTPVKVQPSTTQGYLIGLGEEHEASITYSKFLLSCDELFAVYAGNEITSKPTQND